MLLLEATWRKKSHIAPKILELLAGFLSLQEQGNLPSEMQNYLKMMPCATTKVEEQLKYSRVVELSQFLKCDPGSAAQTPAQSRYPVGMGAAFLLGFALGLFWFI